MMWGTQKTYRIKKGKKDMKKLEDLDYKERQEIAELFANWLGCYTHEVIVRVLKRREEIYNNEFALHLLRELKKRSDAEKEDVKRSFEHLLFSYETFKEYDVHNHCTTHAKSYRDILYDLYIA